VRASRPRAQEHPHSGTIHGPCGASLRLRLQPRFPVELEACRHLLNDRILLLQLGIGALHELLSCQVTGCGGLVGSRAPPPRLSAAVCLCSDEATDVFSSVLRRVRSFCRRRKIFSSPGQFAARAERRAGNQRRRLSRARFIPLTLPVEVQLPRHEGLCRVCQGFAPVYFSAGRMRDCTSPPDVPARLCWSRSEIKLCMSCAALLALLRPWSQSPKDDIGTVISEL